MMKSSRIPSRLATNYFERCKNVWACLRLANSFFSVISLVIIFMVTLDSTKELDMN